MGLGYRYVRKPPCNKSNYIQQSKLLTGPRSAEPFAWHHGSRQVLLTWTCEEKMSWPNPMLWDRAKLSLPDEGCPSSKRSLCIEAGRMEYVHWGQCRGTWQWKIPHRNLHSQGVFHILWLSLTVDFPLHCFWGNNVGIAIINHPPNHHKRVV